MAFSKGTESTEGVQIKRFIGVASVYVKGINPTKEELEKFYDRTMESTPEYTGTADVNGEKVQQVRLDFLVQADPEKYEDFKSRVTFFLRNTPRVSNAGKMQIIDKYGRTAWATKEEIQAKQIPVYSNGKAANIDASYRVAYTGEEELIKFLIAYLGIPSPQRYVNGEWIMNEPAKLADSEAMLEHIKDYFSGNVKELKDIIGYQPNNKVKVLFGIRTTDDGRQFQAPYTRNFLKNGVNDYSRLDKEVKEAKNNGAFPTTEFEVSELHEYVVAPTDFNSPEPAAPASTPWDF